MWWLSLIKGMHDAGQRRREDEQSRQEGNAPSAAGATGLSGGINESAAFGGDVAANQNDRAARRQRWGSFGRGIAQRYLSGGE